MLLHWATRLTHALRAAGLGLLLLCLALPLTGSGPLNGDAAAYAAQASAGVLSERFTHLGYLLLAAGLAWLAGERLPLALDLVSWLCAAGIVWQVACRVEQAQGPGRLAGVCAAAVVLPWAPFGEVDLPWLFAVTLAMRYPIAMALAVALSPTALLALPAILFAPGASPRKLFGWSLGAVVLLTLISRGDWWVGERGVLVAQGLAPGRTLWAWLLHLPWLWLLVLPRERWGRLLWCAPLLLVPADVPAWMLVGVQAAILGAPPVGRWLWVAVAVQLCVGGSEALGRVRRVHEENAVVAATAAMLGPTDGLVAPWTWGARVAVAKTGDPYGMAWHPPGRFLRDQRRQWCEAAPQALFTLPPEAGARVSRSPLGPFEEAACAR